MKPVVALVGRPNVGKSTLFNRLTRSTDALVADFPGLTRDRQYGQSRLGKWPFLVIDTGGLTDEDDVLTGSVGSQTRMAVEEADIVLLLVDARDGLMPGDREIVDWLRKQSVSFQLVVNKTDGVNEDQIIAEFAALGISDAHFIAAAHNRGVTTLVERLEPQLSGATDEPDQADNDVVRVAFVGRPNVGKSTLINRLIGQERVIAYDQPGTTRDSITVPFERAGRQYELIDTAGVRKRGKVREKIEKFSIVKTLDSIERCHVCVVMIDATLQLVEQDLHLLGHVIDQGRALVLAVNKWDSPEPEQRDAIRQELDRRIDFLRFTRTHFISAKTGSGVGDLFKSVNRAWKSSFLDMSTPRLTRLLELAVERHQPPLVNGRRIKLRYAHQGGVNPPRVVIHGKQVERLPESYRRYLANYFQQQLHVFGAPLRIELRQGDNPFSDRRSGRTRSTRVKRK